jgi:hypothetical protein
MILLSVLLYMPNLPNAFQVKHLWSASLPLWAFRAPPCPLTVDLDDRVIVSIVP